MATTLRISCHAPMLWALAATGRRNWVVNFQESTLTSRMLLQRASRGARGKEATNRVMKPNWITAERERENVDEQPYTFSCLCGKRVKWVKGLLTHLQVLIEQAQLAEVLQVVVLLPATVATLWVAAGFTAPPSVHYPPGGPVQTQRGQRFCILHL